jgi:hypothetical protein
VDRVGGRSPKGRLPGPDILLLSGQLSAISYQLFLLQPTIFWRDLRLTAEVADFVSHKRYGTKPKC